MTATQKSMIKLIVRGPRSQSGFGVAVIGLIKLAQAAGYNVSYIPLDNLSPGQHNIGISDKTNDELNNIVISESDPCIRKAIVIDVGSLIYGLTCKKIECEKHILYCTTETTKIHQEFVNMMNFKYDEIWTATRFNKSGFESSGVNNTIKILPHMIDTNLFHPDKKPLNISNRKSFNYIVNVDYSYRKGLHVLLPAWKEAFHKEDDVALIIKMTSSNFKDYNLSKKHINELLFKLDMEDGNYAKILFMPQFLSDTYIPNLYRTGDVYVSPNLGEGFGLPIAEAMASGIPCIVSRCGGPLDFTTSKDSYYISLDSKNPTQPIKDPSLLQRDPHYQGMHIFNISQNSLVKALKDSYADKQKCKDKGIFARKAIEEKLSINSLIPVLTELLNSDVEEIL